MIVIIHGKLAIHYNIIFLLLSIRYHYHTTTVMYIVNNQKFLLLSCHSVYFASILKLCFMSRSETFSIARMPNTTMNVTTARQTKVNNTYLHCSGCRSVSPDDSSRMLYLKQIVKPKSTVCHGSLQCACTGLCVACLRKVDTYELLCPALVGVGMCYVEVP